MATTLRKVKAAKAAEVCRRFELDRDAKPLLTPEASPREFLEGLVSAKQWLTAFKFLAHALPPREAVWWGSLCLKQTSSAPLPAAETAALRAAVVWVLDPTEENRRAAGDAGAGAAGVETPAGALATAVAWTGGSLSPPIPKVPPVPPGPDMPAKAVAGAVALASVRGPATAIEATQRSFFDLGLDVAEGRVVWPDVKPKPAGRTWS